MDVMKCLTCGYQAKITRQLTRELPTICPKCGERHTVIIEKGVKDNEVVEN